jgi:hypothetical protein
MIVLRIFRSACRHTLAAPALVMTLYGVNLLLALPAFSVARSALKAALGNSLAGESLLAGFDYSVWLDLTGPRNTLIGTLLPLAASMAVLSVVMHTFLAGGVLDLLAREKRFSTPSFFRACGTYLGRFFRIWILTAAVLLLAAVLFGTFLSTIIDIVNAQSGSEQTTGIALVVSLILFSFPVLLIFMASDYARIYTVVGNGRSSWKALGRGFQFLFRNPGATLGLHLLLLLLLCVAVALYLFVEGVIDVDPGAAILLLVLLQQLFMVARAGIRVAFSAGEVALYDERKPRPVVFYGWDDSPPRREP